MPCYSRALAKNIPLVLLAALFTQSCAHRQTYWQNLDPARAPYLSMDGANCTMYSNNMMANSEIVVPNSRSRATNAGLVFLQVAGNIAERQNLYRTCMTAAGWTEYAAPP